MNRRDFLRGVFGVGVFAGLCPAGAGASPVYPAYCGRINSFLQVSEHDQLAVSTIPLVEGVPPTYENLAYEYVKLTEPVSEWATEKIR